MTEEEAKTKWCPFARPSAVRPEDCGEVRGNRLMQGEPDTGALCIGSACMAWREHAAVTREVRTDLGELPPGWHENQESWAQIPRHRGDEGLRWRQVVSNGGGYCGLAGAPQ